jgi:hypothetical protein
MPRVGFIYGYRVRRTKRWVNIGQTIDLKRCRQRHNKHARSSFDRDLHKRRGTALELEGPILLETVTGANAQDLDFNLNWQETVWIFKCHTLRRIWPSGLNVCMFTSSSGAGRRTQQIGRGVFAKGVTVSKARRWGALARSRPSKTRTR